MSSSDDREIEQPLKTESRYTPDTSSREVIVKYSGDLSRVEADLGVEVESLGEGFAIITLLGNQIPLLYRYKEIEYIELPTTLTLTLNQSIRTSCISAVHSSEGYNLTGRGVLIGIIDSGIDYTHLDFRNQDGTSKILYIWDQTLYGDPPDGFRQGTEYSNQQINMALNSTRPLDLVMSEDVVGHGTAVAGIAAGNGRMSAGRETGAAPEASLVIVKLGYRGFESFARTTEIMRAFKYILDKAEELAMPVAINLSFGTNDGSHDGSSLFETYINAVAERWKTVIVVAAGNEGAAGHHFSGEITRMQTVDVNFVIAEHLTSLYLTMWKHFSDIMTLELILPSGSTTGTIAPSQQLTQQSLDGVSIRIYYGQPTHYNEDQEIFFQITAQEAAIPQGLWRLRINGVEIIVGGFDIWLPTEEEIGAGTTFTEPDPEITLTIPSTAINVISVGGYNGALNSMAQFSGRGFTRANIYVKPDLVAPAVGILSARVGGGYDSFTGTSMAAPFVTGSAALMMQWGIVLGNDPFLYGQRVKAFLKKGARRNARISHPNSIWGYGVLCLKASMDYLMNG